MLKLRSSIIIFLVILLVGCGSSKPSQFYLLTEVQGHHPKSLQKSHPAVVGIGPVSFSKYLNQPQIVTRDSSNKLHLDEFNRWGEPLADNFNRVLSKNLDGLLKKYQVIIYPSANLESINYQVSMNVYRFDATTDGKVICEANWEILKKPSNKHLLYTSKTYHDTIGNNFSYNQLANSLSKITAKIAIDIARDLSNTMFQ